jgi:TPR repeat protein
VRNLKSAENGDPVAQLEVGKACLEGKGVERDEAAGRKWLEQAALQGVQAATKRLQEIALT